MNNCISNSRRVTLDTSTSENNERKETTFQIFEQNILTFVYT